MGNHPTADIMAISPGGVHFVIDVKGLRSGTTWLVKRKPAVEDLFYVLAFVPTGRINDFFPMSQATTNRFIRGDTSASDIRRKDILEYLDKWDELPA
jgi:hypothetical protein